MRTPSSFGPLRHMHVPCFPLALPLLVAFLLLGACDASAARRPLPTVSPTPAGPAGTLYWSEGGALDAVRAADGISRWKVGPFKTDSHVYGPGAPALSQGILYVGDGFGTVYALDARDGSVRWRVPVPGCPATQPPVVADGVVYISVVGFNCGPSGWIYALRASDGSLVWRTPIERFVTPALAFADGVLFAGSSTYPAFHEVAYLTAIRATDGARLWRITTDQYATVASAGGGVIYLTEGAGVEARRASDGTRLWRFQAGAGVINGPVVSGDTMYVTDAHGAVYGVRASDGATLWTYRTSAPGASAAFLGWPVVAGGRLWFGIGDLLAALDAHTGAPLLPIPLVHAEQFGDDTAVFWSPPLAAQGVIFVGAAVQTRCPDDFACSLGPPDEVALYAVDQQRGSLLWKHTAGSDGSPSGVPVLGP